MEGDILIGKGLGIGRLFAIGLMRILCAVGPRFMVVWIPIVIGLFRYLV